MRCRKIEIESRQIFFLLSLLWHSSSWEAQCVCLSCEWGKQDNRVASAHRVLSLHRLDWSPEVKPTSYWLSMMTGGSTFFASFVSGQEQELPLGFLELETAHQYGVPTLSLWTNPKPYRFSPKSLVGSPMCLWRKAYKKLLSPLVAWQVGMWSLPFFKLWAWHLGSIIYRTW